MRRGRRVRRVVRRVDPWSVLKVSILFWLSMVVVLLVGAIVLWSVAQASGAVGKIESFAEQLGFTDFRFRGSEIFKLALFGGLLFVVAGTVFTTILAFLYNLVSDLVGGIEVVVMEEEAVVPAADQVRRGERSRGAVPRNGGRRPPPPPPQPARHAPAPPVQAPPPEVHRRTVV